MEHQLIDILKGELNKLKEQRVYMEVCGTHTMEIGKMGLRQFLGDKVKLISGPGCPVCVTPNVYIDYLYSLAINKNVSIISYGDMLRVPGSNPSISLEKAKALGADVRVVYSSIDSIKVAQNESNKKFVFAGIGFETTMPSTAILIEQIILEKLNNLFILSLHKKVEPVINKLLEDKNLNLDGFLVPGNVAVILGEEGFSFLENRKLGVISGFSEEEIITSLIILLRGSEVNSKKLINNYIQMVSKEGNSIAKEYINKYFVESNSVWRGLGEIEGSGYSIRKEYSNLDIEKTYPKEEILPLLKGSKEKYICMCGEILKGYITPKQCPSFGKRCTPSFPIGPCMVSSEGTCAAYYKYNN